MMCQEDQRFRIAVIILKTYAHLYSITCNHELRKSNRVLMIPNHFLNKLKSLGKLPRRTILCTIEIVGLYPNIPHSEGLTSFERFLELRDNKQISSDTLTELAEIVLKYNIFEFDEKTFKQVRGTAIGTNFAPPYAILFMADLEEKILNAFEEKPMIWWRYIDDIFLFGNMEKNLWKNFSIN